MKILMIASEASPWAKTGGLADVIGALPGALERLGHHVTVVLPKYRGVDPGPSDVLPIRVTLGPAHYDVSLHIRRSGLRGRQVFVDYPPFFDRDGLYGAGGVDHSDNAFRFGLLGMAALAFAEADADAADVDVVHTHDWQAGLVPALIRTEPRRWPRVTSAGTVTTIHNLAYQGLFPRATVAALGLPEDLFTMQGAEFWGQLSFLKAGINASDWITTVSPTYARETQTKEFGCGLDGVLRARRLRYIGILNGIDVETWNPAADPLLPAQYDAEDLSGKAVCKRALLEAFNLPVGDDALGRPLVGMVSRLVDQKGFDYFAEAAETLLEQDASWVVVGSGEPRYEQMWRALGARYPSRVGVFIGYSDALAHLVEAGADLFLMPSRFEPCGLNQMYSLRYGTVPIVRAVGGLDDTIQPYTSRARHANGFKFVDATDEALVRVVRQALRVYADRPVWHALMVQGMSENHSWDHSAREYVKVYRRARQDAVARQAGGWPTTR